MDKDFYGEGYFSGNIDGTGYDNLYTYEHLRSINLPIVQNIKDYFKPRTVLDVGCALGYFMMALEELGIESYGCDISEYALSKNTFKDRTKLCDIRKGLPYEDDSMDVVYCSSTLEHIGQEYIPFILKEICRIITKGFYLEVPITLGMENKPWGDISHITYMPVSYWISEVYKAGLQVDIRRSRQISKGEYQNVYLSFFKGGLYLI